MRNQDCRRYIGVMLSVMCTLGLERQGLADDTSTDPTRSAIRETEPISVGPARTISIAKKAWTATKGVSSLAPIKLNDEIPIIGSSPNGLGQTAGIPANDLCGNALPILDGVLIDLENLDASTDGPAEPSCMFEFLDDQLNQDIWFDYVATCTGTLEVDMCDTLPRDQGGFDSKVAVYVGTGCPPAGNPLACDDDGCGPFPAPAPLASKLTTRVVRDQGYKIRVGAFQTGTGIGKMRLTCTADHPACSTSQADCCSAHLGGGCSTPECCDAICSAQPSCCMSDWTEACAAEAQNTCQVCGGGSGEECIGCIPVQTNVPYFGTTDGATGTQISPCGGVADIWHCWTADCTGTATVSTCGSDLDTTLSVFSSCGGVELTCNDDGCAEPNTLNSEVRFLVSMGSTYFLRVAGFQAQTGDYQLRVSCSTSPPNNQCAEALPLATGTTDFTTLSANTDGLPLPEICDEGFGVRMGNDVWYDYTAECTGVVSISACNDADFDTRMALYEGCDCPANNGQLVACNDDAVGCDFTSEIHARVTEGTCYKLRVGGFTILSETESGTGTLTVSCQPAAVGDQCDEVPIETLPHIYLGDNTFSSNDCPLLFPGNQTWAAFRVTQMSDVTLEFCGTTPPFENAWLNLAIGCPCSDYSTEAAFCNLCADGNVTMKWFCLPANIYYYPVLSESGSVGPYRISVTTSSCTINNVCASAATLSNGTSLFSTVTATTDGPAIPTGCQEGGSTNIDRDTWYRYTASCTGRLRVSTCGAAVFDTRLALYSGVTCPVTNSRLLAYDDDSSGCEDSTSLLEANVALGSNYLLRVGGAAESGGGCLEITCESGQLACPVGLVDFVEPPDEVVDARSPRRLDGSPAGIDTFFVKAPVGASANCFSLCETQTGGLPANAIGSVMNHGDCTHTVRLQRPITPGAVTTLSYGPSGAVTGSFIAHPGNTDGDGITDQGDVLALLNFLSSPASPPWGRYSTDIDQNGGFGVLDVVALMNVLNGAGDLTPWVLTPRPSNPGICP
ncbi:MAG: hypothetical protein AABZ47_17030 [Planctomycetota bacterium]